jgi:putative exporter of polyketide antibiotics
LQWRTAWFWLFLTPLLLAVLVIATASGVKELYGTAAERTIYEATMGASTAQITMNGRGYDLDVLGGIAAYEVGFMGQLLLPLVGVLVAVRITRRPEADGVLELLTAARVHRAAVPIAAFVNLVISWVVFGLVCWAGLVALSYPVTGSGRYSFVMASFGLAWSGVGLAAAQVASTSRAANSVGLLLVLSGYLIRAVVDSQSWVETWISPMSWVVEIRPWGVPHWSHLIALILLALCGAVFAMLVAAGRDLGSGMIPAGLGRPRGGRMLSHPAGLAWRSTRDTVLGWLLGSVVWVAILGLMADDFASTIAANPGLNAAFGGEADDLAAQIGLLLAVVLATAAGLAVTLRFASEESRARLGLLLAGRRSRWRWWLSWNGASLFITTLVLLLSGTVLGLCQWWSTGESAAVGDDLTAGFALLAPAVAMVGVGSLLTGFAPWLAPLAWIFPVWALIVGMLAEPLRLPGWARRLSLVDLVGRLPGETADGNAVLLLIGCAVFAVLAGGMALSRRDLLRG